MKVTTGKDLPDVFKEDEFMSIKIDPDGNILSRDFVCDSDTTEKELRKIQLKVTKVG